MRENKEAEMLIYPPACSQALIRIPLSLMAVYLLNVTVRSELARGKGQRLLDTESRRQEPPHPWHGVKRPGAAPLIYVHGTSNKNRRKYMNVLVRSVVGR